MTIIKFGVGDKVNVNFPRFIVGGRRTTTISTAVMRRFMNI